MTALRRVRCGQCDRLVPRDHLAVDEPGAARSCEQCDDEALAATSSRAQLAADLRDMRRDQNDDPILPGFRDSSDAAHQWRRLVTTGWARFPELYEGRKE